MNIQSGIFWLILTTFLEARDQSPAGQHNVVKVILNRAQKNNWPIKGVILARKQFSCYNQGLQKAFIPVVQEYHEIEKVTENVMEAIEQWENGNTLNGATHYFNPDLVPGRWPESWDKSKMEKVAVIGDHIFLREI